MPNWRQQLDAQIAATKRAIGEREAEVRRIAAHAEAKGREIYERGIRTGETVMARTPAELRELGLAAMQGRLPQAVAQRVVKEVVRRAKASAPAPGRAGQARPAADKAQDVVRVTKAIVDEAGHQGGAALRGAIDEASLGFADKVSAGIQALASGEPGGFGDRYAREIEEERALDARDERNYGAARATGQVAGFVGSLAATGGAGAAARLVVRGAGGAASLARMARAANTARRVVPLAGPGLTRMAVGGGAVAGAGGQLVSDVASGRRSTLQDYAGAALGGAAGALLLRAPLPRAGRVASGARRLLPMAAGGVEGAVTQVSQDVLSGKETDPVAVARAAQGGAIGARIGDAAGKCGGHALPRKAKERLGEELSMIRSGVIGDGSPYSRAPRPGFYDVQPGSLDGPGFQSRVQLTSGHTRADFVTPSGNAVEAKFGAYARPEPRQWQALRELGPNRYRIDHWLPADIGRIGGIAMGAPGSHIRDEDERP